MSDIFTATGAKLFIGPSVTNATDTAAEYAALAWTEVGMIGTLGEFGDESSEVTFAVLGDGRIRKAKGARNAGTLAITVAHALDDTGQAAMIAAEATYNNYAFKVELPNKLNATGTNELQYFRGLVMSKRLNVGSNDTVVTSAYNVGVNSEVITVPPTAGV
jgi:hypothetical protein